MDNEKMKELKESSIQLLENFNKLFKGDIAHQKEDLKFLAEVSLQAIVISELFGKYSIKILETGFKAIDEMVNTTMFGNIAYSISMTYVLGLVSALNKAIQELFDTGNISENKIKYIVELQKMLLNIDDKKIEISAPNRQIGIKSEKKIKEETPPLPEGIEKLTGRFDNLEKDGLEFMDDFLKEADELCKNAEENLLRIETNPEDMEAINIIFRSVHSLKGSAGFLQLQEIQMVAHRSESLLDKCRDKKISVTKEIIDVLLLSIDIINRLITNLIIRVKILLGEKVEIEFIDINIIDIIEQISELIAGQNNKKTVDEKKIINENIKLSDDNNIINTAVVIDEETLTIFIQESVEDINNLNEFLIEFEKNKNDREILNKIFRLAHKLKSAADAVGFEALNNLMHNFEELLTYIRDNKIEITDNIVSIALAVTDKFSEALNHIQKGGQPSIEITDITGEIKKIILDSKKFSKKPAAINTAKQMDIKSELSNESIRVDLSKLDKMMNQTGELVISKAAVIQLVNSINKILKDNKIGMAAEIIKFLVENFDKKKEESLKNDTGGEFSKIIEQLKSGSELLSAGLSNINKISELLGILIEEGIRLDRIVSQIQSSVMSTRMVAVDNLFKKYTRLVRDLSLEHNKNILLEMQGQDTEIDKRVIDELGDPFTHMVRNSIDHGLETTDERLSKGKKKQGIILFSAYREGNVVCISIKDDGRGLDIEKIKRKAIEKNLYSAEELENMSESEIFNIIFKAGFSTADKVTNISGRGVGMDVVRSKIEKLKGSIHIKSKKNEGSEFIIKLPLTLAVIDAMLFKIKSEIYSISIDNLAEIIELKKEDIYFIDKVMTINLRNNVIPIINLKDVLGIDFDEELKDKNNVLILTNGGNKIGIIVSELVGKESIVIKSLDKQFNNVKGVSGVTILGDGRVCLILDIAGIIEQALKFRK